MRRAPVTAAALAAGGAIAVRSRRAAPRVSGLDVALPPGREVPVTGADGTAIHTTVHGPFDAPTVVLVHGWTCRREFWAAQLNALAADHRVVVYDLRGHGRSELPAGGDYSVEALADDLQAVLDATLPTGQKAVLAGHSLGGMTLVAWARRYPASVPARAAAAVLVSTGMDHLVRDSRITPPPPERFAARAASLQAAVMGLEVSFGRASAVSRAAVRYGTMSRSASPEAVAFCTDIVTSCPRRSRGAFGRTLATLDLSGGIAALDVPSSVLVGTADRLTPPVHAARLAAALPRNEDLVELPGAGHMTPVERPDDVTGLLRRSVDRHLRPALHGSDR